MTGGSGPLLLGLDVGSTHVKAALVDRTGRVLHVARAPTPVRRLGRTRTAHPPDELLGVVGRVLAECAARAGRPIEGLGIASMAEAGALLDASGRTLGEIIPWDDPRSAEAATWLEREVGAAELYRRTGLRPGAKTTLAKLRWLATHRPAVVRRARAWAGVAELVAYKLTGELGTDGSLACRTMAFDVRAGRWDEPLLTLAGFDIARMPPVLPVGRAVGGLSADAAGRLGLAVGLPVVVAGHDHVVGALGAGVTEPGEALDSMGSAEACLIVTGPPRPTEALRRAGASVGRLALGGHGYVLAGLQAAGSLVDERLVAAGVVGADRYERLAALLSTVPPGPTRLVALPYPRGRSCPAPDARARFRVLGTGADDPALAMAAVLDGAACAVRWIFDELERHVRRQRGAIHSVRLIGGGSRIERWADAKSALARWPLARVGTEEATALGAALLGGLAAGVLGDTDSLRAVTASATIVAPPATRGRYERYYRERFLPAAGGGTGRQRVADTARVGPTGRQGRDREDGAAWGDPLSRSSR